jgi:hypothetical protein
MVFDDFNRKGNETENNVKVRERREEGTGKEFSNKGKETEGRI